LTVVITELARMEVAADGARADSAPSGRRAQLWQDLLTTLNALPTTGATAGDEGVRLLVAQLRECVGEPSVAATPSAPPSRPH